MFECIFSDFATQKSIRLKPSALTPSFSQAQKAVDGSGTTTIDKPNDSGGTSKHDLSEQELEEYKETFNLFDKDRNGSISKNELTMVMRGLGQNPTDQDILDMLKEVDIDGNGEIDFSEFITMMEIKAPTDPDEELQDAFKVFDRNRDGFISAEELRIVMTNLGEKLTDQEIKDMLDLADINRDGKIDYNEFVKMMNEK